jgi:hypothetical protein
MSTTDDRACDIGTNICPSATSMLDVLAGCDPRKMPDGSPRAGVTRGRADRGWAHACRVLSSLSSHRHKAFFGALALPLSAGASTTMITLVKRHGTLNLATGPNCVRGCGTERARVGATRSTGRAGCWRARRDPGGSAGTRYALTTRVVGRRACGSASRGSHVPSRFRLRKEREATRTTPRSQISWPCCLAKASSDGTCP